MLRWAQHDRRGVWRGGPNESVGGCPHGCAQPYAESSEASGVGTVSPPPHGFVCDLRTCAILHRSCGLALCSASCQPVSLTNTITSTLITYTVLTAGITIQPFPDSFHACCTKAGATPRGGTSISMEADRVSSIGMEAVQRPGRAEPRERDRLEQAAKLVQGTAYPAVPRQKSSACDGYLRCHPGQCVAPPAWRLLKSLPG